MNVWIACEEHPGRKHVGVQDCKNCDGVGFTEETWKQSMDVYDVRFCAACFNCPGWVGPVKVGDGFEVLYGNQYLQLSQNCDTVAVSATDLKEVTT